MYNDVYLTMAGASTDEVQNALVDMSLCYDIEYYSSYEY